MIKAGLALAVVAAVAGVTWIILHSRSQPAVTVTLRITVAPETQVDFVTGRASSAQFKYLMGKQTGVTPAQAQKLSLKAVPHAALVEARIAVPTKDEGRRYAEAFVPTLQELCGAEAQVRLADQSVR
jgi:hypothetical protein